MKTALEENIIENVSKVMTEILKAMDNSDKKNVRKYTNIFDDFIDQYCLDGTITFHKSRNK